MMRNVHGEGVSSTIKTWTGLSRRTPGLVGSAPPGMACACECVDRQESQQTASVESEHQRERPSQFMGSSRGRPGPDRKRTTLRALDSHGGRGILGVGGGPRPTSSTSPRRRSLRGKGGHTPGSASTTLSSPRGGLSGGAFQGSCEGEPQMPVKKDLKRLVRARMRKTGESYTAARLRVLEKKRDRLAPRAKAPAAPLPKGDLGALAGMKDAAVAKKTGRTWKEWVSVLDRAGAAAWPHGRIAEHLHALGVGDWWSQMVTVGYERIRGLRERGQRRDGTFELTKSKTYPVPVAELWKAFMRCKEWLDGEKLRMSKATKHKTMRMKWSDGTPVEAYFIEKSAAKSQLALSHRKLTSRADVARLRTYWAERLVKIGELLEG